MKLGSFGGKISLNKREFTAYLKNHAAAIERKVRKENAAITKIIIEEVIKSVMKSDTADALTGGYAGNISGLDLQAEFGLEPGMGESALKEIADVLNDPSMVSIEDKIDTRRGNDIFFTKTIKAYSPSQYKERVTEIPSGSYNSEPSGEEIPWIEWLMHTMEAVIGSNKGIVFDLDQLKYGGAGSRSGRAIMHGDAELTARFPWFLPETIVNPNDFIKRAAQAAKKDILYRIKELFE